MTSGFNPRPFCETCDNFLLQDEYDQGEKICPNCLMELSWPNGEEDYHDHWDEEDDLKADQRVYGWFLVVAFIFWSLVTWWVLP